jgi:predicted molibdopterin-dependent oxidoreductase YjgC
VKITSPVGEVSTVVRITATLPDGLLFMPLPFPETHINELFGITLDSETRAPAMKTCSVRLERISAND